ncbi:hypothetical protein Tco_0552672, partial [Tanacetum coccineum]
TEGATTITSGLDAELDSGNIHEITYEKAVLTLVERVKILEKALKRKTKKVILSELEGEEPEDQGGKI